MFNKLITLHDQHTAFLQNYFPSILILDLSESQSLNVGAYIGFLKLNTTNIYTGSHLGL